MTGVATELTGEATDATVPTEDTMEMDKAGVRDAKEAGTDIGNEFYPIEWKMIFNMPHKKHPPQGSIYFVFYVVSVLVFVLIIGLCPYLQSSLSSIISSYPSMSSMSSASLMSSSSSSSLISSSFSSSTSKKYPSNRR